MNRRPVSDRDLAALGEFQGTIDRNSNFRQQAFDHNLGRNVRVAKLLAYVSMLRQKGVPMAGTVECTAATLQNFSSSKSMTHMGLPTVANQAAHFLPGQILVAGKQIWLFATSPVTRGHMEFLFAEVEHLPVAFNQADSAAEAKGEAYGLCAALAGACSSLLRHPTSRPAIAGKIPLDLVQFAYDQWHRDSLSGLRQAIARKGDKPGIPPLVGDPFEGYTPESIAARLTSNAALSNRDDALRILGYYLEDQPRRSWNIMSATCKWAIQEVESNFKG